MTKRSGNHRMQRDRRRAALQYREQKADHVPAQVWHDGQRRWLKVGIDDWTTELVGEDGEQ